MREHFLILFFILLYSPIESQTKADIDTVYNFFQNVVFRSTNKIDTFQLVEDTLENTIEFKKFNVIRKETTDQSQLYSLIRKKESELFIQKYRAKKSIELEYDEYYHDSMSFIQGNRSDIVDIKFELAYFLELFNLKLEEQSLYFLESSKFASFDDKTKSKNFPYKLLKLTLDHDSNANLMKYEYDVKTHRIRVSSCEIQDKKIKKVLKKLDRINFENLNQNYEFDYSYYSKSIMYYNQKVTYTDFFDKKISQINSKIRKWGENVRVLKIGFTNELK